MAHLNLSYSSFSGPIPLEITHLSRLITFDLSGNFYPTIDDRIFRWLTHNLTQLRELILDYTDMSSVSPLSLVNFSSSNLTSLSLRWCNLRGIVPIDIFHLPNLLSLSLSSNDLTGTLPQTKNWTSPLVSLDLSGTQFGGSIPASVGNLTSMTFLDLEGTEFTGSIPLTLGNLVHLTYLDLGPNNFSGTMDFEMFARLKNLQYLSLTTNSYLNMSLQSDGNCSFPMLLYLDLSFCNLTKFPYFLSSSAELEFLDLTANMISGGIPEWFWRVGRYTLIHLYLSDNNFNGPLPDPPPSTMFFHASSNNFSGEIPTSICQASLLEDLDLSNNRLNGTIPRCLGDLSFLSSLNLSYNLLQGPLPQSLANCTSLQNLIVSHNAISDTFPLWLNAISMLEISYLSLSNNEFSRQLPINFLLNSTAEFVDLANNNFEGPLPILSPDIKYYFISNNEFSGDIPYQLCNATGLEIINLFSGRLPAEYIVKLIAMMYEEKGGLQYMGDSNYEDTISVVMKGEELVLEKILTVFTTIDFSRNFFEGEIPESIGDLKALKGLNFSHNNLIGRIPSSVGNLTNLEWLDLSSNKLNGEIPKGLADLSSLSTLNLSYNQLVGSIPHGPQMDTFNHPFDGNPGLCGPPLSNPCDTLEQSPPHSTSPEEEEEEEEEEEGHWIEWRAVAMGC
ncbi:hypothetical protein CRG98_027384 [Punica granatum]|uniref:Uncharacterized protein n=1 Tax=Punica granatum TaxID=22663 RepID=A0A2I0J7J4_PUNGR|nr:hypothetical protein CRG98_027384 [Punica granatum]